MKRIFPVPLQIGKKKKFKIHIRFVHSKFSEFDSDKYMPDDYLKTPGITFIDPFGFKDIPMSQVRKFLGHRKDVLLNLMSSFIHRFKNKYPGIMEKLFGTNKWKEEIKLEQKYDLCYCKRVVSEHIDCRLKSLCFAVKKTTNSKPLYDLIYLSDKLRSLNTMKYAMCHSKQNTYELSFCDKECHDGGPTFYLRTNIPEETEYIYQQWKGRTCTFGEMKQWILTKSPFKYHSKALWRLERDRKLHIDPKADKRKRIYYSQYRNKWVLTFDDKEETTENNETPNNKRSFEDIENNPEVKNVKRKKKKIWK